MAQKEAESHKPQTLGEAAGSLGRPLREIMGERVTVIGIEFASGRKVRALADDPEAGIERGQLVERDCVIVKVDAQPAPVNYFSFSPSLVSKLRNVDTAVLPIDGTFVQRELGNGQKVWDVE